MWKVIPSEQHEYIWGNLDSHLELLLVNICQPITLNLPESNKM